MFFIRRYRELPPLLAAIPDVTDGLDSQRADRASDQRLASPLGIFMPWRLNAYGMTIAIIYAVLLLLFFRAGIWLLDRYGVPLYNDFTCAFIAGLQVLHGETASLYVPSEFLKAQDALVGPGRALYPNWPYPPTFFLILAPLAMLPYSAAFLTWDLGTLAGCTGVVFLIVRRAPGVAVFLASPFTALNFIIGQMAFLTASLIGAALLLLERRPVLAGVFMGCLTYKPQFGILLPVALVAASQWRAFATAAATVALLAGASIVAFGIDAWQAFPGQLGAQANLNMFGDPASPWAWGYQQTVYGLLRTLLVGAAPAWAAQGITTFSAAMVVWLVWRSPVRHSLKAATLSAAALLATPYAFADDLAAIAIPVSFLASDQIRFGLLRGEQMIMLTLFGGGFVVLVSGGGIPLGPILIITLLAIILRRAFSLQTQLAR